VLAVAAELVLRPLEPALEKRRCSWERRAMSHRARSVLEAFEALPAEEREEVLAELIRRAHLATTNRFMTRI
jgi:hypothetical protein